jgi:GTP-binding protein
LPGYGYAKVPAKLRAHWQHVLQIYFARRESLRGVVLVMDIRHPMRRFDRQMVDWCSHRGLACHVLLTKADKLKRGAVQSTLMQVRQSLPPGATAQSFSASKREGRAELIARLNEWYEFDGAQSGYPAGPVRDRITAQATGAEP